MGFSLQAITDILRTKEAFSEIEAWEIECLTPGKADGNAYLFSLGEESYFVKETKDNERDILRVLTILELRLNPTVIYPDLLAQNTLVTEFIPGGHLQRRELDHELIWQFTHMQNVLNDRDFLQRYEALRDYSFNEKDNGFFRNQVTFCFDKGCRNLLKLRKYKLPIVETFIEIADNLRAYEGQIADEFANMPFARQHHDFEEYNIIGSPQKLVDWGSSYGHGPFLFDLAPFLFGNPEALGVFVAHSDICRRANRATIARWLYIATCARFVAFLTWHLEEGGRDLSTREACKTLLEYECKTYKELLAAEWYGRFLIGRC